MNTAYLKNLDPFTITLGLSALLHAIVITAVNFRPPDLRFLKDQMSVMEIVLVNAKTDTAPSKADALAQSNLDRGGNTEAKRQMKTPLPTPKNKTTELIVKPAVAKQSAKAKRLQAEAERKQQRKAEQEKAAQELMTQVKARKKVETQPIQQGATPQPDNGQQESASKTPSGQELAANSLDIARLEAQIARQQDEYEKRPKRRFIGARTQEYRFAAYVEAWRQKVERIGNLNYPEAAKSQKLYGQLRMTVSINADGSIEKVEINKSSGYTVLDDAARRIAELAGPYAVFPQDIRKDTDILSITRTWTFTKEDSLASGD